MARRRLADEPTSRLAVWARRCAFFSLAATVLAIVIVRSGLVGVARHRLWELPELLAKHGVHLVAAWPGGPGVDGGGTAVGDAGLVVLARLTEAGFATGADGPRDAPRGSSS